MKTENQLLTVEILYKILKTLVENGEGSREVQIVSDEPGAEPVQGVRLIESNKLWLSTKCDVNA